MLLLDFYDTSTILSHNQSSKHRINVRKRHGRMNDRKRRRSGRGRSNSWIYPGIVAACLYLVSYDVDVQKFNFVDIPVDLDISTMRGNHSLEMACSENQSRMLTEECMQYNARRISRAFPYRPKDSWCVPTNARGKNSKNGQDQWQGLLYIKVPKVSSSSLAGVALRIHNHTGCEAQWEHRLAKKYNPRSEQTFLLGSMRKPSSRDLSHIQFFNFAGNFGDRIQDGTHQLSAQDYFDHGLYWKGHHTMELTKGRGGYQYKWLTLEPVRSKSVFDESHTNEPLRNPKVTHENLGRLLRAYNFFIVVERMDESLVALAMLMGIDIRSTLVAASAKVSGSYTLNYRGKNAGSCIKRRSFVVPKEVHDHMKERKYLGLTYADQILYRASNISLDLTIQSIGSEIFDKSLKEYRSLKEKASEYCGMRLSSGCYGMEQKSNP